MKRRIVIHCEASLKPIYSRTEIELIRYLADEIIGIIDPAHSGKTVNDVLGIGGNIPIASTLDEFLTLKPNFLLIGQSAFKGSFPMEWYPMVIKALQMRINILNALHQPLNMLAEFELLANKYKAKIYDLRNSGTGVVKYRGLADKVQSKSIMVAATGSYGDELTTVIELINAIHKSGISADWVPTSLSARLIKGKGVIAESMIADLISGYVESELVDLDQKFEYVVIEGQGHLNDPVRSGVFTSVFLGSNPDAVVACILAPAKDSVEKIYDAVRAFQKTICYFTQAKLLAVSVNTGLLNQTDVDAILNKASVSLGVPVFDPKRPISTTLINAIKEISR